MNITTKNTTPSPITKQGSTFSAPVSSAGTTAARRQTPLFIHIAAWSVPVLVLGQFALVAVLPVAAIVIGSFASTRAHALRWRASLLGLTYAAPLALWILRPDGPASLSKDISPVAVGLIVAASAVLLVKILTRRKR